MEPNVELSKTRDFGEIISDTILFIRQNLKPLLSAFFVFCGIFLLATAVATIMQQLRLSQIVNTVDYTYDNRPRFSVFGIETIFMLVFALLNYIAMPLTIISFMALYKQKGNIAPTNEEIWGYFKYYFFRILGSSVLNGVVLIIGFVFCFIPGIYLYPILALIVPVIIIENSGYGYAWDKSFRVIKENWWTTFGVLFVTGLIVSICTAIITVPFEAVNIVNVYLHKIKDVHLSTLSIIFGGILRQMAMVLYILPLVALGLCYFSLTEAKDGTGLLERIDQLGNNAADTNTPAEEY
jgi:hypothetical protein